MAIFLAYCRNHIANHKNGKFTDILKCILWDFDKKSGYFLFLLSIIKILSKFSRTKNLETWYTTVGSQALKNLSK